MNEQANIDGTDDTFALALRELVRTGRVLLTKDDEGRDVYTLVEAS